MSFVLRDLVFDSLPRPRRIRNHWTTWTMWEGENLAAQSGTLCLCASYHIEQRVWGTAAGQIPVTKYITGEFATREKRTAFITMFLPQGLKVIICII